MSVLKFSDIFGKSINKEIKALNEDLKNLVDTQTQIQQVSKETNEAMESGNVTRANTAKATKSVADSVDVLAKSELELNKITKRTTDLVAKAKAERTDEGKALAKATILRQKQNQKIKDTIKLENAEAKSIATLRAENKKLRKDRDNLTTSTDEGKNAIAEINAQIDDNTEVIKVNSDAQTQQKINVGNYASALDALPPGLQGATDAVKGFGQQLKALLLNPVVLLIVAVAASLAFLGKQFLETRAGSNKLKEGIAGASASFSVLKLRAREAATAASDFFDNIKEKASESGFLDKYGDKIKSVGRLIAGAIIPGSAAFGLLAKNIKDSNPETINLIDTVKQLNIEILRLKDSYIDLNQDSQVAIAQFQAEADIQNTIADNATRSFKERQVAGLAARKLAAEADNERIKLADAILAIQQKEIDKAIQLKDIDAETGKALTQTGIEIKDAFTDAFVASIEAANQFKLTALNNDKVLAEIAQDRFEQELDFVLDIADAQKTVNERQIADERLLLGERQSILDETKTLMEESFNDQITLFQEAFGVQLDLMQLQKLNNKEIFAYAEGLGLSEIANNRLREVIKERRLAVQDLADLEKDLSIEEQARLKTAEETLIGIGQDRILRETFNLEARKQLEIQWETAKFERQQINLEKELESIEGSNEKAIEQRALLNTELAALDATHEETLFGINDDFRKRKEAADTESTKKIQQNLQLIGNTAKSIFSLRNSLIDGEIKAVNKQRDKEVRAAEKSGGDIEAINKKFDKKESDLKRKKAEKEKSQQIFSAIIATAAAVVKALPIIPLSILAGVLGAAQIAVIGATPLPEFRRGGVQKETGPAKFSEIGRELMEYKGKTYVTPDEETVGIVPKGAKFTPNWQTEEILKGGVTPGRYEQRKKEASVYNKSTTINGDRITETVDSANGRITHEEIYFRF